MVPLQELVEYDAVGISAKTDSKTEPGGEGKDRRNTVLTLVTKAPRAA